MNQALVSSLGDHTDMILAHAGNLLSEYHPHDLHQFRVHIRRTRSLLKRMPTGPAAFFVRHWKELFAVTGRARDLDVFLISAGQLLQPEQYSRLEAHLAPHVRASHDAVLGLLRSGEWRRHLAGWRGLLRNLEERPRKVSAGHVPRVRKKARKACLKALASGTDRDWHKLRIAVKNLRYVADASKSEPGADVALLERTVEDCKVMQTLLGDWHDTVVQLGLLEDDHLELSGTGAAGMADVTDVLRQRIEQRKGELLAQTCEVIARGNAFLSA